MHVESMMRHTKPPTRQVQPFHRQVSVKKKLVHLYLNVRAGSHSFLNLFRFHGPKDDCLSGDNRRVSDWALDNMTQFAPLRPADIRQTLTQPRQSLRKKKKKKKKRRERLHTFNAAECLYESSTDLDQICCLSTTLE